MLWAQAPGYKHLPPKALFLTREVKGERATPSDSHTDHTLDLTYTSRQYFRFLTYRMDLILSGIVFDELLFDLRVKEASIFGH